MQAAEMMTTKVLAVAPETPLAEIARLLLANAISAVPVIDRGGSAVGMVSEGDLIGRSDADRETRRDWWLQLLAEGEALHPDFLANLRHRDGVARDVMSAPVVTVAETATAREIAQLLATHHIKRAPVLRDGRVVGIVSRADLLRAFASEPSSHDAGPRHRSALSGLIEDIDERFLHALHPSPAGWPAPAGIGLCWPTSSWRTISREWSPISSIANPCAATIRAKAWPRRAAAP